MCWGGNYHGQLGNGTTTGSLVPISVPGINSATRIRTAGGGQQDASCILSDTGGVYCWGGNAGGWNNYTYNLSSIQLENVENAIDLVDSAVLTKDGNILFWEPEYYPNIRVIMGIKFW